jgi:hypothetical protein
LRPAALELAFTQGTNALFAISVGNSPSNDTSKVYVRRRDPAGVVLVAREPLEFWKLNHETFREHRLVNLAEEPLDRIEVKGESAFTLERQSNQTWRVTSPESLPADTGLVRAFLGLLNGLRITKFEQEFQGDAGAKRFGFAPPTRSVTLFRSDTNAPEGRRVLVQLDFGAESEDRELIYVRSADESSDRPLEDSPVYSIPRAAYQKLPTGGWQLRDRAIWRFTTNDVTRIIVRHEDKVMEVIREANGKWGLGPGTTGATNHFNSLGVDYLLDRLGRLDACTMDKVGQPNSDDLWLDRGPEASSRIGFTEKSLTVEVELRGESGNRTLKVALMPIPRTLYPLGATTLDGQTGIFVFPFDAFVMLNSLDPAPNPL